MKKNSLKWLIGLAVVVLFVILFFGIRPKPLAFHLACRGIVHPYQDVDGKPLAFHL